MDWKAMAAIGATFAGLPKNRCTALTFHVTRAGYVFFGAEVVFLLFGLAVPMLLKNTRLEANVGVFVAVIAYYGLLILSFRQIGVALGRRGIRTVRKPEATRGNPLASQARRSAGNV